MQLEFFGKLFWWASIFHQHDFLLAKILLCQRTINSKMLTKKQSNWHGYVVVSGYISHGIVNLKETVWYDSEFIDIWFTFSIRYCVLDAILRMLEAFYARDGYSLEISSDKKILLLLCDLIKFPYKVEVQLFYNNKNWYRN